MIAGFAAIAVPAEYAETGVMTFIVSHQGKVYEKDLGDDTALAPAAIQDYNPDESWTRRAGVAVQTPHEVGERRACRA